MTKRPDDKPKVREFAFEAIYPEQAKRLDERARHRSGPPKAEGTADAEPRPGSVELRQIRFQTR